LTGSGGCDGFVAKYANAGEFLWARKIGGAGESESCDGIAVDGVGNVYVTGTIQGEATFGTTNLTAHGLADCFIAKYNSNGGLIWAESFGGRDLANGKSIALDSMGNIYVCGGFLGTNVSVGGILLKYYGRGDTWNIFVTKLDPAGRPLWAQTAGGDLNDFGESVAVGAQADCYIGGSLGVGVTTFGPNNFLSSNVSGFVAKYNGDGNLIWAREPWLSGGLGVVRRIALDNAGRIYVTGIFGDQADFGITNLTSAGQYDIFLAQYDSDGSVIWAQRAGGAGFDFGTGITADAADNCYLTGSFETNASFGRVTLRDTNCSDAFVAKYGKMGRLTWVRQVTGTGDVRGSAITVDGYGNVFMTGYFYGETADFKTTSLTNVGQADIFVAKLRTNVFSASAAGGGTVKILPEAVPYLGDPVVTFTAVPVPGWTFLQWTGDTTGTGPSSSLVLTRDKSVQAIFGTELAMGIELGSGSLLSQPTATLYPYGTVLRLTAVPDLTNFFAGWDGATGSTNNPLRFVLTNPNPTVLAMFLPLSTGQYSLTIVTDGLGQVAVNPNANRFNDGQNVQLATMPAEGQEFLGWSSDASGTQTPLSVLMDRSRIITAHFTKRPKLLAPAGDGPANAEGFHFLLTGEFGARYQVEATSDLAIWSGLDTLTNIFGTVQFNDRSATNEGWRAYRAVLAQ